MVRCTLSEKLSTVRVDYVLSDDNEAEILTKPLEKVTLEYNALVGIEIRKKQC